MMSVDLMSKLLPGNGKQLFACFVFSVFAGGVWASNMTADHSQFEALQQPFTDVEDINVACVSCHNQAEEQLHDTVHWQWTFPLEGEAEDGDEQLGKLHVLNGYHPNVVSNASDCGSCHIGYGLSSRVSDVIQEAAVDCLMCHDTSGEYFYNKFHQDGAECTMCHDDAGEANKDRVKDEGERFTLGLTEIAQSVGATSVASCGSCHFYDGGADGAKHGDLDSALIGAEFEMDVHMSPDGANLSCSDCHQSDNHKLAGSRYESLSPIDTQGVSALEGSRATCVSCHGDRPMHDEKLNDHTDVVACQACHIPAYARNGISTKTSWDWSTAEKRDRRRRPIASYDEDGNVIFASGKGDMTYGDDLTPMYQWHDGKLDYATVGETIDPAQLTPLNPSQAVRDGEAKIFPFHQFTSRLPYDVETNQLLPINLVGRSRDALWNGYDWEKALKAGARAADVEFSGEYDFADVQTIRALNHTVAPKEQALQCVDCHSENGLMAAVPNVYVPGSGQHSWLDRFGGLAMLAAFFGVLMHGALRWFFNRRRRQS
ncbi:cytochrome c family protein [Reinekea sp. MED297]|uniref:Cytochrome c family protein n=2 Tax=Reinekea TaxID=230494 RepID=A4BI88_9GAMM|nr:cytochrome c family protein [Reinekea sp. MED297] [Reinekea blandensis MED297]